MNKRERVEKLLRLRGAIIDEIDETELNSLINHYYNEAIEKYGEKETIFDFAERFKNAYDYYTKIEIELYTNTFTHAELNVLIEYFESPVSARMEQEVKPYVRKLYQEFINDVYGIYREGAAECVCCSDENKKK